MAAQQPMNNIPRVTLQALAAVLGGTQSLHTNGFDEALSLPTEEAAKLALRTQQVIAHESGVTQTVDPLGGSYFVETLTDEMEAAAKVYMKHIDGLGGAVSAIEQGYIQNEIAAASYAWQKEVEKGDRIVVGVNKYTDQEVRPDNTFRVDDHIRKGQIEKLKQLREDRDSAAVSQSLEAIRTAAVEGSNLMPPMVHAVSQYATLGEIADTLRQVFGEYHG